MMKILVLFMVLLFAMGQLSAWDYRNPLDFDDEVDIPGFVRILVPVAAFTSVLVLTKPDNESRGKEFGQDALFRIHEGAYQRSYHSDETDVFSGAGGFGKMLRPWLAASVNGHLIGLRDSRTGAYGPMGSICSRWFLYREDTSKLFVDFGLGMVYFDRVFPFGGTRFNFTQYYTLGLMYEVKQGVFWQVGYKHLHVSNGGLIEGEGHNPGFDSNGAFAGFVISM